MKTMIANASPTKELFMEMFIRDLSLEDSILDLVDNSIDSLIKNKNIDVTDALLPGGNDGTSKAIHPLAVIEINYEPGRFRIRDSCGGISVEDAVNEVFRFGHSDDVVRGQLGVYGIGLKRAIFKIGNEIMIQSRTINDGFNMRIFVPEWAKNPNWTFPLEVTEKAENYETAGTVITIKSFRPEVAARMRVVTFESHLIEMIARTYGLFLNKYVAVAVNGHKVEPKVIRFGCSDLVNVAKEEITEGNVKATIYAGLAARDEDGAWQAAEAGWYVACNGRLVVVADKAQLTGWGTGATPQFVGKYRGFIGIVFFHSRDPLELPWTTTKRGLNQESLIFQRVRTRMAVVGRPVITFLNNMYSSEETERAPQREVAETIKPLDVRTMTGHLPTAFMTKVKPIIDEYVRVQYNAKRVDIERVRKSLHKSDLAASKVGKYTFDYYLKKECPQ
ncbi:MAG: hypothetical protein A2158_05230 [Chloroflexi bacterium RBG_13_46_14]|nr:MAG: hypothetical protein A2158_05230 [Chloroflexi bacterium RBG_13_46_14]